jgi:hypothetical protein
VLDATVGGRFGIDDDDSRSGTYRVRVAFRSPANEDDLSGDFRHATSGGGKKNFGDRNAITNLGGSYNDSSATLTLTVRGAHAAASGTGSDQATIKGPGVLYTTHIDLNGASDYVHIAHSSTDGDNMDWKDVKLTGNYSACMNMVGLQKVYMDKNLAPASAEDSTRTSTHDTEESQNIAGGLCSDVLTGKVLPPAPIYIPDGDATISFHSAGSTYSNTGFHDGFTVEYVYDDWYVLDVAGDVSGSTITIGGADVTITNDDSGSLAPISDASPTSAWFVDSDSSKGTIEGKVYASGATKFKVILEKVQAPGTWGFLLSDKDTIFGPMDTHGSNGAAVPYYPSGGSTNTTAPNGIGGGPVGARAFSKHGDVTPGSARGNHPDLWEEEVVEAASWGPSSDAFVTITSTKLEKSQGSPPSPFYRFQVVACDSNNQCVNKKRSAFTMQVVDFGQYEPRARWYGDLDPKTRVIAGEITVIAPSHAMGLQGYRLYPTADGQSSVALSWSDGSGDGSLSAQFSHNLAKSCPPDSGNEDWTNSDNPSWQAVAREPCGNDNPYSPKCRGKSCAFVNILPGSNGEFYISRYDNNGNADNADGQSVDDGAHSGAKASNTARRNYGDNEFAQIYLPRDGWLTSMMIRIDSGDLLMLKTDATDSSNTDSACDSSADCVNLHDTTTNPTSPTYLDITARESMIEWTTNEDGTNHGWLLIFQPNYPEIAVPTGSPMANGAAGYRVVSVYGAADAVVVGNDGSNDSTTGRTYLTEQDDSKADAYVETYDWLVPNVTCTPTTMHCPLPSTWAHINYTTPSLYPEPAEGSCLQQKTGTSSLSGCGDKVNLNTRLYSANSPAEIDAGVSQQNTLEEDNGQAVAADSYSSKFSQNWAGNCGDATSYFWFEKIACGSTRVFLTDRSLIEDFVQLTPAWEDIQKILDLYYTTKAPLAGSTGGAGLTFINSDYHVAPVLPPKINCSCLAAMDAYASLLSVVSKTPTPGAPVTLDPEVLNTGVSKMVATLRMYQDPTYSIPSSSSAAMPVVVTRFYLEVTTKFTRNRITISDCSSAHVENSLNATDAVMPRMNYCDNSTFDTMEERSPAGVTHMHRLSMKKFKFQGTTDVFMQCKIRACAQQPCGVCRAPGRSLSSSVDLSPAEGEMFAPPVQVRLSAHDTSALVFGAPTGSSSTGVPTPSAAVSTSSSTASSVSQPVQIKSALTLSSVSAAWAVQNKASLVATLRSILSLRAGEELVITSIGAPVAARTMRRSRSLQEDEGARVEFVVGVATTARARISQGKMTSLASGQSSVLAKFVAVLDAELIARGQPAVQLATTAFTFEEPTVEYSGRAQHQDDTMASAVASSDQMSIEAEEQTSGGLIVLVVASIAVLLGGSVFGLKYLSSAWQNGDDVDADKGFAHDAYSAKIAHSDEA